MLRLLYGLLALHYLGRALALPKRRPRKDYYPARMHGGHHNSSLWTGR